MKILTTLLFSSLFFFTFAQSSEENPSSSTESVLDVCKTEQEGPVSYYGQLERVGNKIHGSKVNKPVQVRGMSLFWSIWGGELFYNETTVDTLTHQWKIELIRAAIAVDQQGGLDNNYEGQVELAEKIVKAAIKNDIYVLIDFHTHYAEQYTELSKKFFSYFAQKYGACDHVLFEIYNEPIGTQWNQIKPYAEAVIPSIRAGSDNLVIVGTSNYSQRVDQVIGNEIDDPNTAYTLHFYAASHTRILQIQAEKALDAGIALFVTEWGTVEASGDGEPSEVRTIGWWEWMDKYQLSWANWALNEKNESASTFYYGISLSGRDWTADYNLRPSGKLVLAALLEYAKTAPWRENPAPVYLPPSFSFDLEGIDEFQLLNLQGQAIEIPQNFNKNSLHHSLKAGKYFLQIKKGTASKTIPLVVE